MNKNKSISILLFLLLLLIILCTWCHTDKIAKSTLLAHSTIPSENKTIVKPSTPSKEKLTAITIQKAKKIEAKIRKIISFEDINFELNNATLTEKSIKTISQIATVLKENPNVHVEISGHTDNSGEEAHNLKLSQARVDTVKNNLVNMQVSPDRIKAVGYGETKPLVSNDTEENRRINRRVEFKILGE